jgi:transcriptional regulator with XRE-family HTH domain
MSVDPMSSGDDALPMSNNPATLLILGRRLREARRQKGFSQEELAARAGFDRTYISLVERGRRNLSILNLLRFAKALDIAPADLVRGL